MIFNNHTSFNPSFGQNNMLIKLIYANLAVFIGIKLLFLPFWLMQLDGSPNSWALQWLAVPSYLPNLITRPWSIISYMFLHLDLWHIFSNMLWLFFLGQLFVQFLGERKLWTLYISGGIAGALLYVLFFNLFPVFETIRPVSKALGASASVMAIVIAIGTYMPNYSIRLLFLGDVKLKYIALFSFILDVISISNSNSGGHIAHIGGAAMGFIFARQWQKGKDITAWAGTASDFIIAVFRSRPKSNLKVKYKSKSGYDDRSSAKEEQAKVDAILDKISRSGYDSLSKEEKDILFKASKK